MNLAQRVVLAILQLYRRVGSPVLQTLCGPGWGCRFEPSCSVYAKEAVRRHGVWKGTFLALRRLLRCHPWGGAGWDPVPGSQEVGPNFGEQDSCRDLGHSTCRSAGSCTLSPDRPILLPCRGHG
ncbi:MAG: membrane protein insertion efficiency factor YidD [Verrucomicrobiota bacterium]|nr:membrane protein insertion efficiency factor YidD [Limisphaera sp.]MDW8381855.1 membrane protein insertion efficiency factor YidD [Verrucomicrobiota bacterium]